MEKKLLNVRTKDEKKQGGVSWCLPRKMRAKGKKFFTITVITLLIVTLLLWSYQRNPPLLSPQDDQFSQLPSSVALQIPKDEVFAHGETKDEQKPMVSVENTKYEPQEPSVFEGSPVPEGSSVTQESSVTKKENIENNSTFSSYDTKVCNYANGRWVLDERRPLYSGSKCKRWLSYMWACRITQRTDFGYEGYRWQPTNCDMPEFERFAFLKRMQDKTIAFVGDSLGRQQFQSLMCMATGGEDDTEIQDVGHEYGIPAFRFVETNTTILYYWSSCLSDLVPLNTSDPNTEVAMHLDRPPSFLKQNLHRFDVLVLNTGHHWNRGKVRAHRWVLYANGKPHEDRSLARAKNLTIFSITKWLDSQLPSHPRLKVFFRTLSPRHFFNGEWNTGGSCESTTSLARGSEVKQDESSDQVTASAVRGTKVNLLDITALSKLRDEGHISRYSIKANSGIQDCLHWCLPGIPDTWNEILAAQL